MQFQPGDLVELKSGGPVMTVDRPDEYDKDKVWCSWFDSKHNRREEAFEVTSLKPADPKINP